MWRKRYSPLASIVTPVKSSQAFIQDVVIHFEENMHSLAELTVRHFIPRNAPIQAWQYPDGITWDEQTPVHFRYRMFTGDVVGDFYGYVMSQQIVNAGSDFRYNQMTDITAKYTIIGMTFFMQDQQDKLWKQCTPSSIARDIASKYGMRAVTEPLGIYFQDQMQSSQSDWKFLADTIAQRISARLALDGASTLYFTEYTTPIPSVNGSWPVFSMSKKAGALDTLRSFTGTTGDTDPLGGYRLNQIAHATSSSMPQAVYIPSRDADTTKPIKTFTKRYTLWPGSSYAETERYLKADSEPLWMFAQATTDGDPRLKVGALVEFQGDGVGADYQGKWIVRSAIHRLHQAIGNPTLNTYTCDLEVGRNQPNRLVEPANPLSIGVDYGTVLVGNRWRAKYTTPLTSSGANAGVTP